MTKEQFVETLSGFIAPRLVEALAEQAEGKGYFEEASEQDVSSIDIQKMAEKAKVIRLSQKQ